MNDLFFMVSVDLNKVMACYLCLRNNIDIFQDYHLSEKERFHDDVTLGIKQRQCTLPKQLTFSLSYRKIYEIKSFVLLFKIRISNYFDIVLSL